METNIDISPNVASNSKVEAILKRYKEADALKLQWKDKFQVNCCSFTGFH